MNTILVPLKKHARVDKIVPFIENVAQPGTSVVFLVRHPVNGLKWLQAYSAISQCGIKDALAVNRMAESYSIWMRAQLSRQKVFDTCAALHKLGLKIAVDVYTGSLRETLRSYGKNRDHLVVMQPGIAQRVMSFLEGTASIRAMFKRPLSSSVILQHSNG